jgi:hypothetical protein
MLHASLQIAEPNKKDSLKIFFYPSLKMLILSTQWNIWCTNELCNTYLHFTLKACLVSVMCQCLILTWYDTYNYIQSVPVSQIIKVSICHYHQGGVQCPCQCFIENESKYLSFSCHLDQGKLIIQMTMME